MIMNVVVLKVNGAIPGTLTYEITRDGKNLPGVVHQIPFTIKNLFEDEGHIRDLLPPSLVRDIRQWVLDQPAKGILAVDAVNPEMDSIPWEYLPELFQWPSVTVVRLLEQKEHVAKKKRNDKSRMLAAGWSGKPWYDLPAIQDELNALSQVALGEDINIRVLFEPSPAELIQACKAIQPVFLHLVPPGIEFQGENLELIISGDKDLEKIQVPEFLSRLSALDFSPDLVVLNSCHGSRGESGISVLRLITRELNTAVLGWYDQVYDKAAYDFSLFFYNRLLLEGESVLDAFRSYKTLQSERKNPESLTRGIHLRMARPSLLGLPVLWATDLEQLSQPIIDPVKGRKEAAGTGYHFETAPLYEFNQNFLNESQSIPKIELDFEPQAWLNPALLKNGRPVIVNLAVTPDRELPNAGLSVTCDTGNGSSKVRLTMNLKRGRQPIPIEVFNFPILYQLIQENVSRRRINFTASCQYAGFLLAETTRSVLWMEATEWLDKPDTWHYIPAFVNPFCEGVMDVIDKADAVLKNLATPTSSFSGYQTGNTEDVARQVEALFNCLRTEFKIKYIAPPPVRVFVPGEAIPSGQRVRPPDEVIKRLRGTCHDLAILLASCMEHIGIFSIVVLIQGHTYVGFWNNKQDHTTFWEEARRNIRRLTKGPGKNWTITDKEELRQLFIQGKITFLEGTSITNPVGTFPKAVQLASQYLGIERQFDVAVDVQASRYEIQPL